MPQVQGREKGKFFGVVVDAVDESLLLPVFLSINVVITNHLVILFGYMAEGTQ